MSEAAQATAELPDYGWVRFRKADVSEPHAWQPQTVKALQSVVGSARNVPQPTDPAGAFAIYTRDVIARDPAVLRDLLEIRPAGPELVVERGGDAGESVQAVCGERDVSGVAESGGAPDDYGGDEYAWRPVEHGRRWRGSGGVSAAAGWRGVRPLCEVELSLQAQARWWYGCWQSRWLRLRRCMFR